MYPYPPELWDEQNGFSHLIDDLLEVDEITQVQTQACLPQSLRRAMIAKPLRVNSLTSQPLSDTSERKLL